MRSPLASSPQTTLMVGATFRELTPTLLLSSGAPKPHHRDPSPCPCTLPPPAPKLLPPFPSFLLRSPKTSATNFRDFTPDLLTHMAAAETGRLVFRNVAPAQVDDWLRRYPEVRENADFRYEYDSLTQRFMVKCSPCAVHESFSIFFKTDVILGMAAKLGPKTVKKILQVSSGSGMLPFVASV